MTPSDRMEELRTIVANPLLNAEMRAGDAESRRTLEAAREELEQLERQEAETGDEAQR